MADPVFFAPTASMTLAEVAGLVEAGLVGGDPSAIVRRVAALDQAGAGDLTFLDNPRYLGALAATRASGCLIARKYADRVPPTVAALVVDEPYRALARVMQALYPDATRLRGPYDPGEAGVSPAAHVHPSARLEDGVTVEPGAVIGAGAEIGAGTVIAANAVIGRDVRIGRDCYIGSHASVQFALIGNRVIMHPSVSIGQDGFGFAMSGRGHLKMPQIGRVVIQDDVEIGAGTAIDRGANRDTVIGEGSKIDNQCQIGHNVEIGRHVVIVSQVGISGSSRIEDFAVLAGKVGVSGHVTVGPGAQVAGASQVVDDVPARAKVMGYPAKDLKEFIREKMALQRLAAAKGAKE